MVILDGYDAMKALDTALICSGSPGFLRSLGSAMAGQCRLLECYSLSEAGQIVQMHRPDHVVLDLRSANTQQIAKALATASISSTCRVTLVIAPGQMTESNIPQELQRRLRLFVAGNDLNSDELTDFILREADSQNAPNLSPSPEVTRHPASPASNQTDRSSHNRLPAAVATPVRPSPAMPSGAPAAEQSLMADRYRTRTPELRSMLKRLEVAARHNVTMLLIGETGSGKTHLASLIHDISPRANEPFLHVACGALPGELIESELFGHVKGAFTSAHADKDGKFLVAGNGTILLDEIDVLTPDQQVKLLRVIEKGEFEPVGSNRTLHVKARIIAASNLQLQPLVEQGRFRPDLYYRLNTLSFNIPPLRKRLPDIEPLARYFVHHHAAQLGIDVHSIADEFLEALLQYPWPGNVREMENAIRSAVIYSHDGNLNAECLPLHIVEGAAGPANDPSVQAFFAVRKGESLENRIELTEKDIIEQALLTNNFSRTNTARHLGISRVTLYNKMRKYGILPER